MHKALHPPAPAGVWERVFYLLMRDRENDYLMIGNSIVATGQKGIRDQAVGPSRGG